MILPSCAFLLIAVKNKDIFKKRAKESPAFKHGEELAQIFTEFILDISCELW